MRKFLLFVLLASFALSNGQITKEIGNFNKIKVFDRISVELVSSAKEAVEITGSRAEEVEVINKNGELKIRMSLKKLLDGEEVTVKVYFKKIESIDVNEGSLVGSQSAFTQEYMYVSAQEGAKAKLILNAAKVDVKAATGGTITLSGKTATQNVELGAGGILNAKEMSTSRTTVKIKAGGSAEVRASELVDANVTAGGKVRVYGKPKSIKEKTTLGGTIEQVGE